MKNPANPGDFSTNGTRDVVLSGMSETTNSADFPIGVSVSITQTCGKPASEFEMLTCAWYALGAKMRAAERGAGRETTNSPAEIGAGCTGRQVALDFRWLCLVFVVAIIAGVWKAAGFWVAVEAVLAVWWWDMFRNWRASNGERV